MSLRLAPIVLFCYNRPVHLRQTLDSLRANTLAGESELFIFSDGPKSKLDEEQVNFVRALIRDISGFKKVVTIENPANLGLAQSVIKGVTHVIEQYGKVIVLEDDMLTTPDFLDYMNETLSVFEHRNNIFTVTGYSPPVSIPDTYHEDLYLAPRASSWGWGTWKDKWEKALWQIDHFDQLTKDESFKNKLNRGGNDLWPMLWKQQKGVINSWAVRWTYTQTIHNAYGLYPVRSKLKNIGTDGSGTNFTFTSASYGSEMDATPVSMNADLQPDAAVIDAFRKYYDLPLPVKIKNWFKYRI